MKGKIKKKKNARKPALKKSKKTISKAVKKTAKKAIKKIVRKEIKPIKIEVREEFENKFIPIQTHSFEMPELAEIVEPEEIEDIELVEEAVPSITMEDLNKAGEREVEDYIVESKAKAGERVLVFMAVAICTLVIAVFWWKTSWGRIAGTDFLADTGADEVAAQIKDVKSNLSQSFDEMKQQFDEIKEIQIGKETQVQNEFNKILIQQIDYVTSGQDYTAVDYTQIKE